MSKTKFKARKGVPCNDEDAQTIGTALEKLRDTEGPVKTEMVVEAAKRTNSPLHKFFDWDIKSAAGKHWKHKARQIMGWPEIMTVTLTDVTPPPTILTCRAFTHIKPEEEEGFYVSTQEMLDNKTYRDLFLEKALKTAEGYVAKFWMFTELAIVVEAIERARDEMKANNVEEDKEDEEEDTAQEKAP